MGFFSRLFGKKEENTKQYPGARGSVVGKNISSNSDTTVSDTTNYEKYAREAFLLNVIGYASVTKVARSVASVPWKVYKRNKDDESELVLNHPLNVVLNRPNPTESMSFFVEKSTAYALVSGSNYLQKLAPITGPNKKIPMEMYSKRPDRMSVIANKETGIVTGYVYQNELTRVKTVYPINPLTGESDILHMKTFNPLDDYYGTPAIDPARLDIDTNNEAGKWNSALMQNGAKPGTAFVAKGPMSDKEYERLEKTIMEKYSGAANAGKSILINTPDTTDVKHLGFSPADMDYLEGERKTARRIALAFGVPPQLLGIPGDSTYSNYKEARTAFWEDTVMYWLNFYKEELNWWFFGGTDVEYYIDFDLNDVPALAYKQDLKWDRAIKSDFLKENEKRNMVGYDSVEGGDAVYKPASEMTAYGDDMLIPNIDENENQVEEEEDEAVEKLQQIGLTLEEAENVIGVQNDSKRISCKNDYFDGHK